jgi:hypothetical protein
MGVDEEIFVVDLKKGAVSTGPSFPLSIPVVRVSILVRVSERNSLFLSRRAGPYQGKPDATFTFTDDDFLAISSGKLNPQMAFIR